MEWSVYNRLPFSHLFQHRLDLVNQLGNCERFALNFVVSNGVDQELTANQKSQLPKIQLGNKYFFVTLQHIAQIAGERIQVPQMSMSDRPTVALSRMRRSGA